MVPPDSIEEEYLEDIRHWTKTGITYSDMFRLIASHFAPLEVGETGRQKASETVHVVVCRGVKEAR